MRWLTLVNEYLIREASTKKSLKIRSCNRVWGPTRGELSNIKCVIRLSRYPAHAQTLLQHIHTERSAFAQSPRTSYRSQNTLNPVLCVSIYCGLPICMAALLRSSKSSLTCWDYSSRISWLRPGNRLAILGLRSGWRARDILVGGF